MTNLRLWRQSYCKRIVYQVWLGLVFIFCFYWKCTPSASFIVALKFVLFAILSGQKLTVVHCSRILFMLQFWALVIFGWLFSLSFFVYIRGVLMALEVVFGERLKKVYSWEVHYWSLLNKRPQATFSSCCCSSPILLIILSSLLPFTFSFLLFSTLKNCTVKQQIYHCFRQIWIQMWFNT